MKDKAKTQKPPVKKIHEKPEPVLRVKERYFEGIGRRKTAVARVRMHSIEQKSAKKEVIVNDKKITDYFPSPRDREKVLLPLKVSSSENYFITANVRGGGVSAQSEAIRLGLSRAIVLADRSLRPRLKASGYLRRDPRMVERKKFGSRKARRPQQWRKR